MTSQPSLFDQGAAASPPQLIRLKGADLAYFPCWLTQDTVLSSIQSELALPFHEALSTQSIYQHLRQQVAWEQSTIRLYGKDMLIPRLNAWYAEPQYGYTYSGKYFAPEPWLPLLLAIQSAIEKQVQQITPTVVSGMVSGTCADNGQQRALPNRPQSSRPLFNSALVNCYRDGQDSVGWHSDDEPELGKNPVVASVSLGAERVFQLRHKYHKGDDYRSSLPLQDGDLLIMYGETQHHWQHQIPKTQRVVGGRINITYRHVRHSSSQP